MHAEPLPFLSITEVDDGPFFVAELFRRKFGGDPPREGRHLVAFHRDADALLQVAGYAHFRPFDDLILVGGVCTNGAAFARMSAAERDAIAAAGGIYFRILKYGFANLASQCEAFFGYCGDARAEVVNLQAGFRKTGHPYLLAHFHKPQDEAVQRALIAKAAAIGPF